MICTICEKDKTEGKIYTLIKGRKCVLCPPPEASKIAKEQLQVEYPQQWWVCQDCLANPLRCFADTLLEMWDIFPMTSTEKIDCILKGFESGIRLPKGVSLTDLRDELKRRAS